MAYQKNVIEGRGRLLTNTSKKGDKSPDYRGDLLFKGELIKLSAWQKDTPYGTLISLSIDTWKPDGQTGNGPNYNKHGNRTDEDIPF